MKNKDFRKRNRGFLIGIIALFTIFLLSCRSEKEQLIPITSGDDFTVYLPLLMNGEETPPIEPIDVPTIHIPYIDEADIPAESLPEMAVFWFGKVKNKRQLHRCSHCIQ